MSDEFNHSDDVKKARNNFNNDFHERCMQEDEINNTDNVDYLPKKGHDEMSIQKENEEVLKKIKSDVIRFGMANMYNFSDTESARENFKKSIDNMFRVYSNDPTITESINHTGFPDDIVIMLIALNTGYNVISIRDFSSVVAVWHDDEYKIGYMFELEFSGSCTSVSIDVDTMEEGFSKCE